MVDVFCIWLKKGTSRLGKVLCFPYVWKLRHDFRNPVCPKEESASDQLSLSMAGVGVNALAPSIL